MKKLFILLLITVSKTAAAQVTVTGPTCVTSNVQYTYDIGGAFDSSSNLQVCITGGSIVGKTGCRTGSALNFVLVNWSGASAVGTLSVSSAKGNASLKVSMAPVTHPGIIATAQIVQQIGFKAIPTGITCTVASGGNCTIAYQYQWQQSPDAIGWSDITNATAPNLSFSAADTLSSQTYYRRRLTETNSGSISYSNIVSVLVAPDPATLTISN